MKIIDNLGGYGLVILITIFVPQIIAKLIIDCCLRTQVNHHVFSICKQLLHAHLLHETDKKVPVTKEDIDSGSILGGFEDWMRPHLKQYYMVHDLDGNHRFLETYSCAALQVLDAACSLVFEFEVVVHSEVLLQCLQLQSQVVGLVNVIDIHYTIIIPDH